MKTKNYIITFAGDRGKAGVRAKDMASALKANALFGHITAIAEGDMRSDWVREGAAKEAA
jgi:hypothetical protein